MQVDQAVKHHAAPDFWEAFGLLDPAIQNAAKSAFALMKSDPRHPSIRLKKTGRYWSARIGRNYSGRRGRSGRWAALDLDRPARSLPAKNRHVRILLGAQGDHRVDARRTARGHQTPDQRDRRE